MRVDLTPRFLGAALKFSGFDVRKSMATSTDSSFTVYGANGRNDVTTQTTNAYGMVQFPESGSGIARYGAPRDSYSLNGQQGKHGDNWANPHFAADLYNSVQQYLGFSSEYKNDTPLMYNDISAFNPAINLGHTTHKKGTDVDFRYMGTDGQPVNDIGKMDPVRQATFTTILEMNGATRQYSNRGSVAGTTHKAGHSDHEHSGRK